MRSELPKIFHDLCGRPLLAHVLDALRALHPEEIVVVRSGDRDDLMEAIDLRDVRLAVQHTPRGTGDALLQARNEVSSPRALVIPADLPLLSAEALRAAISAHVASGADLTVLSAEPERPEEYGRILRDAAGRPLSVIEAADASPEQLEIREVNTGIYIVSADDELWTTLSGLSSENAQRELYLTDLVGAYVDAGNRVDVVPIEPAIRAMGINTRADLATAARFLFRETAARWMEAGVTIVDPERTYIEHGVSVGRDARIFPDTHLCGATSVGASSVIGPGVWVADSVIESGCTVRYSTLEGAVVREGSQIGPYAHLRPGADVGPGCRIGNFVEVKASRVERGVKAGHLSYIGDAYIGEGANLGAGTVTCNYDGTKKHRTQIGREAFIGSHAALVAPVTIGEG
ncbi:MAG: bifunctional UDP-N-acetylglucosamine diphosphorylase/glucosamine-1-phosphate N-acetyltransferase GlmU, partial [Candidatus Bipolaricaulota bacterium]